MTRYVALLRGIAPSGKNMSNDILRATVAGLGFADVGSVLASGNILFTSSERSAAALERRIDEALAAELELTSRAIVRSLPELRALVDTDPFPSLMHGPATYLTATFLKEGAAAVPVKLPQAGSRSEIVGYDPAARAILAVTDNREPGKASGLMASLEKAYGTGITTRTWLTVQRIVTRLQG